MNQSLIVKLNNTAVFFINDKNISYYLSIPMNGDEKVNIAIQISDNLDNNNITQLAQKYDNQNLCMICPVFDEKILLQAKTVNEQIYVYMDRCISYLINNVYKMLNSNKRVVDNKIILIRNHDYLNFEAWFVSRYKERVQCIDNEMSMSNHQIQPSPSVVSQMSQPADIPVVNTENEKKATSVLENTHDIVTNSEVQDTVTSSEKDLGFVSYVLLGVVVAVAALVILYLLI